MDAPVLAVIGGGNMAHAILGRARGATLQAALVVVAEPDVGKHAGLRQMGVEAVPTAAEAMARLAGAETHPGAGQILLAVKPQMLRAVAEEIGPALASTSRVVISILAGVPSARVREVLGGSVRVVRAMPNLAARIGRGATALCAGAGAAPGDEELAGKLFADVSGLVVRIDEGLMDAFTAVAGSGPAYVFYLAEAMVSAAESLGFDNETAMRMVRETIAGAGALLAESADGPAELRAAVTSRGGTTAAALAVLDGAGVRVQLERAIAAARDRGAELAKLA
ncbi:MAG: pyrroline-5-carboxylate reductase [Phycisphaerales bacterium]|nr:pyrroline-5-carboxylate reductase [Phycisphaerales bacterium]